MDKEESEARDASDIPRFMQKAMQFATKSLPTTFSSAEGPGRTSADPTDIGDKNIVNQIFDDTASTENSETDQGQNSLEDSEGDSRLSIAARTPSAGHEAADLVVSPTATPQAAVDLVTAPTDEPKTTLPSLAVTAQEKATTPKRPSSSRLRIEKELSRMAQADANARLRETNRRRKEVAKAVSAIHAQKRAAGVTLTPYVEESRAAIRGIVREEERMALEKEQAILRQETARLQAAVNNKFGLRDRTQQQPDLVALTENFYRGNYKGDGLPDSVRRELTRSEIADLRMVYDMFDMKGRGYITANDVKRAAGMLGFKAKKEIFKEMIEEVTGDRTFANFLQFVIKGQGQGDDPLEDILQGFRLLDQARKGYVTVEDLRRAAEDQKLPLSNRALREMVQEADMKGDAKVTATEFIDIMLQTSLFRTAK